LAEDIMAERLPLYYTFGNHMHWVDMEWLWGYSVLPNSVRDMLSFCRGSGAKGNINFDAIGYEKMAVESPEALAELREAIAKGQIEVVGASYGQPYGLFHGGESNVRQRIYGVRAVMRVLGVRPKTFWEEEFDFFPQLPQMLRGVGYEYGSLFFQWTWHTPVLPHEKLPAIWWEGVDGSRLLAAPRNDLNLHQWPEDFAGLLESPLLREMPTPGIVQWLELMPSPDWMCRAELLLPQLKMLMEHPTLDIRFATLSEYLDAAREHAQPRSYTMDDVFHGMSLGKNGDLFRRLSRRSEQSAFTAESLSAMVGLFGRPYPSWDVYPTWELEESWRELLSAQHHDNDECEGLCGFVGQRSYERSMSLSGHIVKRTMRSLADRVGGPAGRTVVYNPLGWSRDAVVHDQKTDNPILVRNIPPFGYHVIDDRDRAAVTPETAVEEDARTISLQRGTLKVTVDKARGVITQLVSPEMPAGALRMDTPLADLEMTRGGEVDHFAGVSIVRSGTPKAPEILIQRWGKDDALVTIVVSLAPELPAVDIRYMAKGLPRPDPRTHASLQTTLSANLHSFRLVHDYPYGVGEIKAEGTYLRKYPTGDWMTSKQVFEEVHNPFTALQLLDFDGGDRGLLYLHDGSQAFLREPERKDRVRNILSMYDAWDEDYFISDLDARVRLVPHGRITNAERWKLAQEFTRPVLTATSERADGNLPQTFGSVWFDAPGVAVTAFYRETAEAGGHLDSYAGAGIGYPYIVRLVELNGQTATGNIRVPGSVAAAFRTNLMGEIQERLNAARAETPVQGIDDWNQLALNLRPYEIATVYLDLELGRKVSRNLDDYRHVWATVHRVEEPRES
jgi:alpha-mannosidase